MEARILKDRKDDEPFMVADLGDIVQKCQIWRQHLNGVKPFYAVKCNCDITVLRLLAAMGIGFDCASKKEIEMILSLGVSPSSIIYAHPCKSVTHLRYAKSVGVDLMTFDNEDEIQKIKREYPNARTVMRIKVDDSASFIKLGKKFGCLMENVRSLLEAAIEEKLNVVGVSFHAGCEHCSTTAVPNAIKLCKRVFDIAANLNIQLEVLNIGGGYPGRKMERETFLEIANAISVCLKKHFPEKKAVQVISEPGRYFVSSAFTLYTNVIGTRHIQSRDGQDTIRMYFVNDGIYGCFHFILFHKLTYKPIPVKDYQGEDLFPSCVWGPTCDSRDLIVEKCMLPKLEVGDWIKFEDMGDYSLTVASSFNGFRTKEIVYIDSANKLSPAVTKNWDPEQYRLINEEITYRSE